MLAAGQEIEKACSIDACFEGVSLIGPAILIFLLIVYWVAYSFSATVSEYINATNKTAQGPIWWLGILGAIFGIVAFAIDKVIDHHGTVGLIVTAVALVGTLFRYHDELLMEVKRIRVSNKMIGYDNDSFAFSARRSTSAPPTANLKNTYSSADRVVSVLAISDFHSLLLDAQYMEHLVQLAPSNEAVSAEHWRIVVDLNPEYKFSAPELNQKNDPNIACLSTFLQLNVNLGYRVIWLTAVEFQKLKANFNAHVKGAARYLDQQLDTAIKMDPSFFHLTYRRLRSVNNCICVYSTRPSIIAGIPSSGSENSDHSMRDKKEDGGNYEAFMAAIMLHRLVAQQGEAEEFREGRQTAASFGDNRDFWKKLCSKVNKSEFNKLVRIRNDEGLVFQEWRKMLDIC